MICDMHFHLRRNTATLPELPPAGCVVSQHSSDNIACLEFAQRSGIMCALYSDTSVDPSEIIAAISSRKAMAYKHVEVLGRSALIRGIEVLKASNVANMPVVLHLSRHDGKRYASSEVYWCLDLLSHTFPNLKLIISHLGGENFREVLEWAKRHKHIYLDTSRLHETATRAQFSSVVELLTCVRDAVPHTRLLYGSDSVWPYSTASAHADLDSIRNVFPADEVPDILANNGLRLFN